MSVTNQNKNKFTKYVDHFGRIVDEYLENPGDTFARPGTRGAFEEVTCRVVDKALKKLPEDLSRFRRPNTYSGLMVMARSQCLFSLAARNAGLDIADFERASRDGRSFDVLASIASAGSDALVQAVEMKLHLNPSSIFGRDDTTAAAREYTVSRDGSHFVVPNLERYIEQTRKTLVELGGDIDGQGCMAHKAGALAPLYQSVITLATRHPNLVKTTLS